MGFSITICILREETLNQAEEIRKLDKFGCGEIEKWMLISKTLMMIFLAICAPPIT